MKIKNITTYILFFLCISIGFNVGTRGKHNPSETLQMASVSTGSKQRPPATLMTRVSTGSKQRPPVTLWSIA